MTFLNRIPWRFYGLWMLPLCSAMAVVGYGTVYFMWPVFFPVVVKEFGWSAAVAATAFSLGSLHGGLEGPLVGYILDRWGPRIVMFISGILMGVGLMALNWLEKDNIYLYFIFFGLVVNLGFNAGLYSSSYKLVANWWIKRRAMAITAMTLPCAIAGFICPSVATRCIASFGWRTSCLIMGAAVLVVYIPASLLVRPKRPEAYGLLPDGDEPEKFAAAAIEKEIGDRETAEQLLARETLKKEVDWTIGEAIKTAGFWLYSVASIFSAFAGGAVISFAPSHLAARGYSPADYAFFAGFMLLVTLVGRFIVMFLADIFSPKRFQIIAWMLQCAGVLCLANATLDSRYLAWGYGILYGVGYGIQVPITPVIRGWLFGRAAFGKIYGIISCIAMLGLITAPTFAGWIFDTTRTYYIAYMAFGAAFCIAAFILAFAKRPTKLPLTFEEKALSPTQR